jgi:hypothetical protein
MSGSLAFAHAQQTTIGAAGGTVTGHVICGDTRRPARFASVMLFGVPAEIPPEAKRDATPNGTEAADLKKAMDGVRVVQTQTDVDGGFVAHDVAPGDYYVFASVAGYVQPNNLVLAAYEAGSDLHYPISGIPTVHVMSEHSVRADLTAERGAAVSGTVVWDDGSPAARVKVSVVATNGKKKKLPPQLGLLSMGSGLEGMLAFSDDLGHFRIAGLAPGEYFVKGELSTRSQFGSQSGLVNFRGVMDSPLTVFAPAAFHQADAKEITLHTGEERDDEELTINLGGMHSVSGRVASVEDHHGISVERVTLEDAQDKDFSRSTNVDANGGFTVTFVPPGSYNLLVSYARDTEPSKEKPKDAVQIASYTTVRSYQDGKQAVTVTDSDVTGMTLELAPAKTVKPSSNPED